MRLLAFATLVAALIGWTGTAAIAQSGKAAKIVPVPEAKTFVVPVAKLMRVDEGVFELEIGKTIDLTDRKMLLSIRRRSGQRKECCEIMVNGERVRWRSVGSRINLKRERGTQKFVEDKEVCYLDVVDLALPKGTAGIATFRLHCI